MVTDLSNIISKSALLGMVFGTAAATSGEVNQLIATAMPHEANQAMHSYYQENPDAKLIPGIQALGGFHVLDQKLAEITGNKKIQSPTTNFSGKLPSLKNVSFTVPSHTSPSIKKSSPQSTRSISRRQIKNTHWRHPDEIQFYRP